VRVGETLHSWPPCGIRLAPVAPAGATMYLGTARRSLSPGEWLLEHQPPLRAPCRADRQRRLPLETTHYGARL